MRCGVGIIGTSKHSPINATMAGLATQGHSIVMVTISESVDITHIPLDDLYRPFDLHSYPDHLDSPREATFIANLNLDPVPTEDHYVPPKKEDPKPNGFDHTKFSRRKRR